MRDGGCRGAPVKDPLPDGYSQRRALCTGSEDIRQGTLDSPGPAAHPAPPGHALLLRQQVLARALLHLRRFTPALACSGTARATQLTRPPRSAEVPPYHPPLLPQSPVSRARNSAAWMGGCRPRSLPQTPLPVNSLLCCHPKEGMTSENHQPGWPGKVLAVQQGKAEEVSTCSHVFRPLSKGFLEKTS